MSAGKKRGKLGRGMRAEKASRGVTSADLWNYAKAARHIGIAEKTLQAWVERGIYAVPHIRLGRLIRFQRTALDSWLARGGTRLSASPVTSQLEAR